MRLLCVDIDTGFFFNRSNLKISRGVLALPLARV